MKQYFIIILSFFCVVGCVSGGENITIYDDAQIILDNDLNETTVALEDGHLNTSFILINKTETNTDSQNHATNNTATNKSDDLNATDMQNIENELKGRTINNNHTQIMKPMELMQTGNPFVLLIISLFMVFICRRK